MFTLDPRRALFPPKHNLVKKGNRPTRRQLFGPVDREQLQEDYQDALNRDLEDAMRRWGFDFKAEKPLEGGDFQWEGVPEATVPALYRSWALPPEPAPRGKENVAHILEKSFPLLLGVERTPEKCQHNQLKRKQTSIKDFYQTKRRVVATPRKSGQ